MRIISAEELKKILSLHVKWLTGKPDGVRADLCRADLCRAILSEANLREADLLGADLRRAILREANLCGANLCGANLCGAYLWGADLSGANLCGANLSGANLCETNLCETKGLPPIACPEEGSFIGFKRAKDALIKLEIQADALRSSATTRKCRCSKARVISIESLEDHRPIETAASGYDHTFVYRVGEIVSVDNFDTDRWTECAPGIHFFLSKEEARNYEL